MRPRGLQDACGCCIARNFSKRLWALNITQSQDRVRLVKLLLAFGEQYRDVLVLWGLEQQLYRSLITCLRNRLNPPVFLTAMLVFCPKVTIDQIAMLTDRRHVFGTGSGLYMSQGVCWGMLEVLNAYQAQQSLSTNQWKGGGCEHFTLPTTCLVLEGVYFAEPDFLKHLLQKMPSLRHISLQHNGTGSVMKTLSKHCKLLESLCFLEPSIEVSILEKDIFSIFFGIPASESLQDSESILKKFTSDKQFRESFEFQFPNLRKLDIDELFFDEEMVHSIYTITLILQPKLMCFGKHIGLTKWFIRNYKKIWSTVNDRPECEATLQLSEARFVDSVSVAAPDATTELDYWEKVAPVFENLVSVELQKSRWSEDEIAKFCDFFSKQVKTFSLGELPLSNMSCLSNMTHLRLTLSMAVRIHYSFDKVHLILDTCPSLRTLSIHQTLYHDGVRRNNLLLDQPNFFDHMIEDEDLDVLERLMLDELMGEAVNLEAMVMNLEGVELHHNENRFPWGAPEIPPPNVGREALEDVRSSPSSRAPRKGLRGHHNLRTLRIASLCEASRKQTEDFLRGVLERLQNLCHLCLGMWMGSPSQRLTCTANAFVSVVTDKSLREPLLPHLTRLCCLPSGTEKQMCQSLAALVEELPALDTLVLPALDNFMLAPTLRYFQHSSLDIQYKCATDQVFLHWEPEH